MKIKVCGMGPNLERVAGLEPNYLGFIFWKPSARYYAGAPPQGIGLHKIGVFVDAGIPEIIDHINTFELDGVQLHGNESPGYCRDLQAVLLEYDKDIILIKAFQVSPEFQFNDLSAYTTVVNYFLFDAKGELPGGNGIGFNWELLSAYKGPTPYFLSGGIGPEDIDSIRAFLKESASTLCHAIDVNSGFEHEPGIKDIERLEPFVAAIKELENKTKQ